MPGCAVGAEEWEQLYQALTWRRFVGHDPIRFVYRYRSLRDRELAGWIAACLAYGHVKGIEASVTRVLEALGERPAAGLQKLSDEDLRERLGGFCHRWTSASDMVAFLAATRAVTGTRGTLSTAFRRCSRRAGGDVLRAADAFIGEFRRAGAGASSSLIAAPSGGSACKRLLLYLRWMGRCDRVDPGCWSWMDPAALYMPVDTHVFRAARMLGMTSRRQATLATVLEVTSGFRQLCREDPVRYDFALTRLGMRPELAAVVGLEAWAEDQGVTEEA